LYNDAITIDDMGCMQRFMNSIVLQLLTPASNHYLTKPRDMLYVLYKI